MLPVIYVFILWLYRTYKLPTIYHRYHLQYGVAINVLRKFEKLTFKVKKLKLDLEYFEKCKYLKVLPQFLKFKIPQLHVLRANETTFEELTLNAYIKHVKKLLKVKQKDLNQIETELRSKFTFIRFCVLKLCICRELNKRIKEVTLRHNKKLKSLWLKSRLDRPKAIRNLSSYQLTVEEEEVLSYGLKHNIIPNKLNYNHLKFQIEKSAFLLAKENKRITKDLKTELIAAYNKFKKDTEDICRQRINKRTNNIIRKLKNNNSIEICPFDKGQGIAILDSEDYFDKVKAIVNDTDKFVKLQYDGNNINKHPTCSEESKVIRYLQKHVKNKVDVETYQYICPNGSDIGKLYGSVKVHKVGNPIRPIVSTINSPTYNLAKYLDKIIKIHIKDDYMLNSTNQFIEELYNHKNIIENASHLVSFDVESLFTNVPINEVIEIAANYVYNEHNENRPKYDKKVFKDLLKFATSGVFMFQDNLYKMRDGIMMGSPLGPSLANMFLAHLEDNWQKLNFSPIFYRRYVDDSFAVFKDEKDIELFHKYINKVHNNLKFTIEKEKDCIAFLDVSINKENSLNTRIHRKKTFTGILLNFSDVCPTQWKKTLITGLLYRIFTVVKTWNSFHDEVKELQKILLCNNYPSRFIEKQVGEFLNKKIAPNNNDVKNKDENNSNRIIMSIPYLGKISENYRKKLIKMYKKIDVNVTIVFHTYKIKNFFSLKSKTPKMMKSSLVYNFQCREDPSSQYIGKTKRRFHQRVKEHATTNTAISVHLNECQDCQNNYNSNFKIIYQGRTDFEISVVEALSILEVRPNLNKTISSNGNTYFLKIFN